MFCERREVRDNRPHGAQSPCPEMSTLTYISSSLLTDLQCYLITEIIYYIYQSADMGAWIVSTNNDAMNIHIRVLFLLTYVLICLQQ